MVWFISHEAGLDFYDSLLELFGLPLTAYDSAGTFLHLLIYLLGGGETVDGAVIEGLVGGEGDFDYFYYV